MENKNKVTVNASTKEILKMLKKSGLVIQVKESKVDDVKSEFDNKAYHNTDLLLKQYRTIKWMIECFPSQIEEELSASFEDFDDLMLKLGIEERAYSNYHISGRAKSLSKSRMILELVNQSLTVLKKKPKNGDFFSKLNKELEQIWKTAVKRASFVWNKKHPKDAKGVQHSNISGAWNPGVWSR